MGGMKEPGVIAYKFTRKELQNSLKYRFKSTPENKILELCLHRSMSKRKRKYHAALSFYHVATELRECVLRNLWSDAVHLMLIFLDAPRRLLPLIWQNDYRCHEAKRINPVPIDSTEICVISIYIYM
ncbi:uncharacterized protein [Anabrus simplex]|uniref:uncharacterized protein isoform X2 n=1 Tax=Anabrus simplex TaxID=316456 RepID=UPI0035A32EFE